jgi:hypothetical protein
VSNVIREKALRPVSISSTVAFGEVATGVGVASDSTHAISARALTSVAANASRNHSSSTPMPPGVPGGIGGDVTASATVRKNEQSATRAGVLIGDHVGRTVSSTDPTLVGTIDIAPTSVVGKVTAVSGDVLTIAGPHGESGTVVVRSTKTSMNGRASASLGNIAVSTAGLAQETFGSRVNSVDATTVGSAQSGWTASGLRWSTFRSAILDERNRRHVPFKISGPGRSLPSARVLK